MGEDLYAEKLAWFKQNEKPEVVLLVADNQEYVRLVIAWSYLNVNRSEKPTGLKNETENEIWDWLWENARYSKRELIEILGGSLSELGLENKLKPLIGNRIVYPDGTVNSFVQRYLRERVVRLFEIKPKRTAKNTTE
ncbi:MAG: hypothetical protein A2Z74_01305 [Chloroflexi bacterium RBG_13_46_9]|jgi:hypothetical protein|nr:MAG: hypothetical protein A2Z74_01305 [Chloroflexi bacterium RBG_13_46_9]